MLRFRLGATGSASARADIWLRECPYPTGVAAVAPKRTGGASLFLRSVYLTEAVPGGQLPKSKI